MNAAWISCVVLVTIVTIVALLHHLILRPRGYDRWLGPYVLQAQRRIAPAADAEVHVLLCFADHYEPKAQGASADEGQRRVEHWVREFPRQFGSFRDSSGRAPRYSFFFPIEEYEPGYLDALAEFCRQGFGEVEVHLHHDNATAESLRGELLSFTNMLVKRHGLLARWKKTGATAYGFIHGNWALCNSRPDGRCCGVDNELDILRETGCYADFTFPSAPSLTQPPTINSIYYAWNRPGRPRSADNGVAVGTAPMPAKSLMLIEGPLLLDWRRRKWGVFPRLENGCLQASQPPSLERLEYWLRARVQVPSRPDWFFVKLHAHGAPEDAHEILLGEPMRRFHEALAERARANPRFHYHYVTAREMYNLAKAAEAGFLGAVAQARDHLVVSNLRQ